MGNTKKKAIGRLINIVALIGIVNGVLVIFQAALLAYVFQQLIIEQQHWKQLISSFIILSVVFIFRSLCSYYYQVLGFKAAVKVKRSVREELLNKISLLGPAYVKQHQSGELSATTLEHTEALEGYFSRYLPQKIVVSILPLATIMILLFAGLCVTLFGLFSFKTNKGKRILKVGLIILLF